MSIQVGDKLAQKDYAAYRIFTVIKILPSGRLKVQWDDRPTCELTLNPDLSVRGERDENRLQIITPDIQDAIERLRLLNRIAVGYVRHNQLTLDQLRSLQQWMIDAGLLANK